MQCRRARTVSGRTNRRRRCSAGLHGDHDARFIPGSSSPRPLARSPTRPHARASSRSIALTIEPPRPDPARPSTLSLDGQGEGGAGGERRRRRGGRSGARGRRGGGGERDGRARRRGGRASGASGWAGERRGGDQGSTGAVKILYPKVK